MFSNIIATLLLLPHLSEFLKISSNQQCVNVRVDTLNELYGQELGLGPCVDIIINNTNDSIEVLDASKIRAVSPILVTLKVTSGLRSLVRRAFSSLKHSLDIVVLNNNDLPTFKVGAFEGLILRLLDLKNNSILYLGNYAFADASIYNLDLKHNKISVILRSTFPRRLFHLEMGNNSISFIQAKSFPNTLITLDVSYNMLSYIEWDHFYNLENLESLVLASNRIGRVSFTDNKLRKLITLDLSFNRIKNFTQSDFAGMTNLRTLNLRSNYLKFVNPTILDSLSMLKIIDVSFNHFTNFPHQNLSRTVGIFNIFGNPWNCDCLKEIDAHSYINNIEQNNFCGSSLTLKGDPPICLVYKEGCSYNENAMRVDSYFNTLMEHASVNCMSVLKDKHYDYPKIQQDPEVLTKFVNAYSHRQPLQ